MRKTKIIATIGKSSMSTETMVELINAGMDIARISPRYLPEGRQEVLANLREAMTRAGRDVGLMLGLRESDIRIGPSGDPLLLKAGTLVRIVTQAQSMHSELALICNHTSFPDFVSEGDELLIDFGKIRFTVVDIESYCKLNNPKSAMEIHRTGTYQHRRSNSPGPKSTNSSSLASKSGLDVRRPEKPKKKAVKISKEVVCRVENDCKISTNIPVHVKSKLTMPINDHSYLQDIIDIQWAKDNQADFIVYKQIRDREDLEEILSFHHFEAKKILGVQNKDSAAMSEALMDQMDAVLVGRGTLALETSLADVCKIQKEIIKACNQRFKPVVISTQLLESMIQSCTPTSAEVIDVTNAVLDGCDAVILSAETAHGMYPVQAVQACSRICIEAERQLEHSQICENVLNEIGENLSVAENVSYVAVKTVALLKCKLIICITKTGRTAQIVSRFVPPCPILAITKSRQILRQLRIIRGVEPVLIETDENDLLPM